MMYLRLCVCVCIYIYSCIYICVCVYIYIYSCIYICVCVYIYMNCYIQIHAVYSIKLVTQRHNQFCSEFLVISVKEISIQCFFSIEISRILFGSDCNERQLELMSCTHIFE